jgi:hypothetical protein
LTIPRLWPEATAVIIACGPSLTAADVELVRQAREADLVRVIVINAAVRLAPWADVRFAHHAADWQRKEDAEILAAFKGLRLAIEPAAAAHGAQILRMSGPTGLEFHDRGAVRHGQNGGYQAIGVAVHLGARRVILLGYDMRRAGDERRGRLHFYECKGTVGPVEFTRWIANFETLVAPLRTIGVEVVNASRATDLKAFPRVELEVALAAR